MIFVNGVSYAFGQSAYMYVTGSSYREAKLVIFHKLKPLLAPAVQTH